MEILTSLLNTFGITHDRYPYLFLSILIIAGFSYLRISIGTPLRKVRDNILVIVTHLASAGRSKLDTSLIKQMSPLQIQPEGQKVLEESKFTDAFSSCKDRLFSVIDSRNPQTKLEVENSSIYSYLLLSDEFKSIQVYLYENPSVRETFPTLAGVYIRDKYLEAHPEITK